MGRVTSGDHLLEVLVLSVDDLIGALTAVRVVAWSPELLARHRLHVVLLAVRNESGTLIYVADDVKPDRPPRGGEQARTRLARRAVVSAARALFLEQGYTATTIEAISTRAEVPPATIYRLFASKLGILEALLDASIAGDDQPVAVADRPNVAAVLADPDPVAMLNGVAAVTTAINQRTNDVYRVLASAAGSDPAAAELLTEIQRQRSQGQGQIARALDRSGSLRAGLRVHDALDLIHALMAPEVYRLLVVERSWPPEKYERWLATTLVQQLT